MVAVRISFAVAEDGRNAMQRDRAGPVVSEAVWRTGRRSFLKRAALAAASFSYGRTLFASTLAPPTAYPGYAGLVAAAKREARLTIFGSTSGRITKFLIDDFGTMYPEIDVTYVALPPAELDRRLRRGQDEQSPADVAWSIGMDLMMKQALEGHALAYKSPEAATIPPWAQWRNELYGATYEPVVLAYNRRLLPDAEVPRTHDAFLKLLQSNAERFKNKVTTYDTRNPEIGAIALKLDASASPRFWQLADAMAALGVNLQSSTDGMMDRVSAGESLIAYNAMGLDAITRAKRDPVIGIAFMTDYDLVLSRVLMILRDARHANAAKLWVDYVLSPRGQKQLYIANMYPIRDDAAQIEPGVQMLRQLSSIEKPAVLDPALAQLADTEKSNDFERRFQSRVRASTSSTRSSMHESATSTNSGSGPQVRAAVATTTPE